MTGDGFRVGTDGPDTVMVSGTLGFATAAAALKALDAALAQGNRGRLDLAGVDVCDSAGLACVLAALAGASGRGHGVRVAHAPDGMLALAQVSGVASLLG